MHPRDKVAAPVDALRCGALFGGRSIFHHTSANHADYLYHRYAGSSSKRVKHLPLHVALSFAAAEPSVAHTCRSRRQRAACRQSWACGCLLQCCRMPGVGSEGIALRRTARQMAVASLGARRVCPTSRCCSGPAGCTWPAALAGRSVQASLAREYLEKAGGERRAAAEDASWADCAPRHPPARLVRGEAIHTARTDSVLTSGAGADWVRQRGCSRWDCVHTRTAAISRAVSTTTRGRSRRRGASSPRRWTRTLYWQRVCQEDRRLRAPADPIGRLQRVQDRPHLHGPHGRLAK